MKTFASRLRRYTPWAAEDLRISFRDGQNLPLMQEWQPALLKALQTSAVLVAVTSPAYFQKRFCGQEYYIFDQRRRQNLPPGTQPPGVILPIIWAPVQNGLPDCIDKVQWQKGSMHPLYESKGLRYLKKLEPTEYERCVIAFAEAIKNAWEAHKNIPELPNVAPFEDIPNTFAAGTGRRRPVRKAGFRGRTWRTSFMPRDSAMNYHNIRPAVMAQSHPSGGRIFRLNPPRFARSQSRSLESSHCDTGKFPSIIISKPSFRARAIVRI